MRGVGLARPCSSLAHPRGRSSCARTQGTSNGTPKGASPKPTPLPSPALAAAADKPSEEGGDHKREGGDGRFSEGRSGGNEEEEGNEEGGEKVEGEIESGPRVRHGWLRHGWLLQIPASFSTSTAAAAAASLLGREERERRLEGRV